MINKEELEKIRTPVDLQNYISTTLEKIKSERKERERARLKLKGSLYKEFIEELYPLSVFCSWRYPNNDVTVQLIIGDQGYDAIVYDGNGVEISHIEITWPIDGHRQKQEALLLNDIGYVMHEVCDPIIKVREEVERVYEVAIRKSRKDYSGLSGASLVILINFFPYFLLSDPQHRNELNSLMDKLKSLNYLAENVYLVLMPDEEIISIVEN